MIDYKIKWNEIMGREDKGVEIYHVATRELILHKLDKGHINHTFNFVLLPLFDQFNRIKGTQLIQGDNNQLHFVFE